MVSLKTSRQGKELEKLVATLERVLADTGATIESPSRRQIDRDTGRRREHDVLIAWDHGHHQIITAIECRDRSRPVGVTDVEAFADKCERTGIHSGVIVSASSFTGTARQKAGNRSITCMDLSDVASFDWMGTDVFVGYERRFSPVNSIIMFEKEAPGTIAAIFDSEGTEVSNDGLAQTIINGIPVAENPDDEVDKTLPVRLRMNTINWTVRDDNGRIWPISHVLAQTSFTTIKTVHPVTAHSYVGGGKSYEVAIADAQLGQHAGRFVMMKGEDGAITVSWTPKPQ
jgi:hypothetical protein